MASQSLDDLVPELKEKALLVKKVCTEAADFDLQIYCTLRTLEEQARLYRQSRSCQEIELKLQDLRTRGFGFLASVLESVGPCTGEHVTNAAPGESWHNFGQAFDAVPLVGGKPAWNYFAAKTYWNAYGEAVRQAGLHWAGDWVTFREYPHAQLPEGGNPLRNSTPDRIYQALLEQKLIKV